MPWEQANAKEQSWCPWARSAGGAELLWGVLGASVTAAVALVLVFKDGCAILHL